MPQMGCGYHVCRCVFINIRFDYINCELINIIHQDQIRIKDIEGLWCFDFLPVRSPMQVDWYSDMETGIVKSSNYH